jgi:TatD DNase family protein
MLVDTHCHIESDNYNDKDDVIKRAFNNNVKILIINGYDKKSNKEAIETANKYENIYATIGYHPSEADKIAIDDLKLLEEQLMMNKVIGIGEIGLDYYWTNENKDIQKELFIKQILLANKYNKNIIVHSRDAIEDTYEILKKYKKESVKGILHNYSSSLEMAEKFIKLGMLFGIGGVVTFKNNKIIEVIKKISMEYIVLETDSPYLTPDPYRGKKNEPFYLNLIANKLAETKAKDVNEVCEITSRNAVTLFDLNYKI